MVAVRPRKNVGGRHKFDFVLDEDEFGEFCVVPVSGGKYFAKIDPEDYEEISQCRWYIKKPARKYYSYYAYNRKRLLMHRKIMNPPGGIAIDHINGDGLDNRRTNLRIADACQNQWNQRPKENGTSKFKGVVRHKEDKKWRVKIRYRGKHIWLGNYDNEIEAARAYDRAAVKYFGAFARLNFPACAKAAAGKLQEQKMSYAMDEQAKTKATKRILQLKECSAGELWEILAGTPVGELEDMCKVMQCNIAELSTAISRQATACLPSQGRAVIP
jgi:hypothetical protein